MTAKTLKHIVISEENYQALKEMGQAGESFNDVVNKILRDREIQK